MKKCLYGLMPTRLYAYLRCVLPAIVVLLSHTAVSPAACVTSAAGPGCMQFAWLTSSTSDPFTNAPTTAQELWMQNNMGLIIGYQGYWDSRLSWFPRSWVYRDISSLYANSAIVSQHPEWVLHDQSGEPVYFNWGCSGGTCPQYAPDFSNAAFRSWWLETAHQWVSPGYKGLFVDDVNLVLNLSNGSSSVVPVDPNTGAPMTKQAWEQYQADFLTQIRNAFPGIKICHNSLWFAGNAQPASDPAVMQQIKAADFVNIERGFADTGLTGDGSFWSIQNLMSYIDQVHALGANIIAQQYVSDGEFSPAAYFMINSGSDFFGNDSVTPANWPAVYNENLGAALGPRFAWNNLIRRDFANGMVLIDPPGQPAVSVALPRSYTDSEGTVVESITLQGRQGAVLLNYVPPSGPVPDGVHTITCMKSQLVLSDPGCARTTTVQMVQEQPLDVTNQAWRFTSVGYNLYTIQNLSSGFYLTAKSQPLAPLQQAGNNGSSSMVWSLQRCGNAFVIVNRASGLVIDDTAQSLLPETGIIVYPANGGSNQAWMIP